MRTKKVETDPRQQIQSPSGAHKKSTNSIVPGNPPDVKYIIALQDARRIPTAEIVETVAAIYPKFDRFLLSKVRNGKKTGVRLRKDALDALTARFGETPSAGAEGRRKPRRAKPMRISCRLTDEVYGTLQRLIARRGVTMQRFLEEIITSKLNEQSD